MCTLNSSIQIDTLYCVGNVLESLFAMGNNIFFIFCFILIYGKTVKYLVGLLFYASLYIYIGSVTNGIFLLTLYLCLKSHDIIRHRLRLMVIALI